VRPLSVLVASALVVAAAASASAAPIAPSNPKLERATVRLDDLPSGWAERSDDIADAESSDSALEFCGVHLSVPLSLNASSFDRGDPLGPLFSYAIRLPPGEARRVLTALRPKMDKGCTKRLDSGLEDVPPIEFSYRSRKVPVLADQSIGFQTTGRSLFSIKAVLFRKGDVLMVVSSAREVDVDRIAAKVAARI
jgi:hypothetical protein